MKNTNKVSIKTISIKHFRSITSVNISADKLNIFVGLNDVGKSNILKALNLFFNGETDYNQGFVFEKDFSKLFPEKNKKAKEIEIKITFDRGIHMDEKLETTRNCKRRNCLQTRWNNSIEI
jgi:predicted ATP-dependent endonuclease of OLD family